MTPFTNRAISASAGTGKTFRLAHRFLGLLSAGVGPDRICAMTFSRKAAGEIFDRIVERLCAAAADADARALTARMIAEEGFPPPGRAADYVRFLRSVLDQPHRLRIGTLDSFLLGVARAFPLELGIPPETRPVDGDGGEAQALRQAILARLADPTRGPAAEVRRESAAFLDLFRQAHYGRETKTLSAGLERRIVCHHGAFLRRRPPRWRWGDPDRIWPAVGRWWDRPAIRSAAVPPDLDARLRAAFGAAGRDAQLGAACAEVAAQGLAHAAGRPWPLAGKVAADLLRAAAGDDAPELEYYRKTRLLPADLWPPLRRALAHLVAVEVEGALARTQGLAGLLERYDRLYAETLRAEGCYTFEDLARMLGAGEGLPPGRAPDAPNRLYIDYRLDGRLDHWLLDEFQDTSDAQWDALRNLVDEVVQGDDRSFFYVGDVKQSIYGWRGGNYRLFDAVREQYAAAGPHAIRLETIARCHRSLPAVIEAVNRVFDEPARWAAELDGGGPRPAAVEAFARAWTRHASARTDEGAGYAALLEYAPGPAAPGGEPGGDEAAAADPAEFEAAAAVLDRIRPVERGLTAAVLVRTNETGRACVNALRRRLRGVPVTHEGVGGIADHPVVTLLLALARYAAHPGDTVALRHLQMSPLARRPELADPDALPAALLADVQARGFAGVLRDWGARLGELGPFGRRRLRELLDAAERFDASGDRDADAFADFIAAHQVRSPIAADAIRVMTVHQAKGLGFDVTIVPFPSRGRSFESPGDPDLLAAGDWTLVPPVRDALEAAGGAPLAAREDARSDANFAQLCVLYVALTRAQRALYLLVPARPDRVRTAREDDLLRARLAGGTAEPDPTGLRRWFAAGDERWFEERRRAATAPAAAAGPAALPPIAPDEDPPRREPSKEHRAGGARPAAWLFDPEAGDRRAFGSEIHRLFEAVEWIETADPDRIVAGWRAAASGSDRLQADVERQFRACCADAGVRRALARPAGAAQAEVWREASFDVLLERDGRAELVGGRFDRLVVERDAAGAAVRATVFDFKSNIVRTAEEIRRAATDHAPQMEDYRRAAARLLGLPADRVAARIVFTRPARIVEMPPGTDGA